MNAKSKKASLPACASICLVTAAGWSGRFPFREGPGPSWPSKHTNAGGTSRRSQTEIPSSPCDDRATMRAGYPMRHSKKTECPGNPVRIRSTFKNLVRLPLGGDVSSGGFRGGVHDWGMHGSSGTGYKGAAPRRRSRDRNVHFLFEQSALATEIVFRPDVFRHFRRGLKNAARTQVIF